ncbi:MAG: hypothetical protein A2700_02520 [Candidatus Blackburnbacteria bacterium RIFCSPHIGHO2_01_FULL_44_64]|nr:MAG: hypothetical protein A2700_02520 [Candidatus Blackburnbacteria bacterium RIFCSPHIGHO2_01_FULL_44_64]OGY14456.1 MAG: hypothetical protein A3A62_00265 [Candidatus Blackburnbacteria bacterium RIFCSPLOWO2_01_FULL_44_43]
MFGIEMPGWFPWTVAMLLMLGWVRSAWRNAHEKNALRLESDRREAGRATARKSLHNDAQFQGLAFLVRVGAIDVYVATVNNGKFLYHLTPTGDGITFVVGEEATHETYQAFRQQEMSFINMAAMNAQSSDQPSRLKTGTRLTVTTGNSMVTYKPVAERHAVSG